MANFFTKAPKDKPLTVSSRSVSLTNEAELDSAGPSTLQSDYYKAFKPFTVKRDVEMAPINYFHQRPKAKTFRESHDVAAGATVIVLDDDEELEAQEDVQTLDSSSPQDLNQLTAEGKVTHYVFRGSVG